MFDPFIRPNALANHIDINTIACDYILISHAHGDHIADVIPIAVRTGATLIGVFEVMSWFEKQGITKYHAMNTGGSFMFDFGRVKLTNAIHSSVFPDGSYGGNPVGFTITENDGDTVHYAGDTALSMDMQLVGYQKPKVVILPIGDNFTMGFNDACKAAHFMDCHRVIGVHYDTFPPIRIDKVLAKAHFERDGRTLLLPEIGETITL